MIGRLLAALLAAGMWLLPAAASAFETKAPYALLMDASTGTVLFEKNADELMAPASMAKLMTVEVLFDALKSGRISMDDQFTVSEYAWREGGANSGGSTMFAKLDSRIPVSDLLRGIIVQSGNDASIVVAEGMAGSELAFSNMMNDRARKIGMTKSTFRNATGLPDEDQRVTARGLARLAQHLIEEYPEYYPIFAEESFTWNGITQANRNPLMNTGLKADGLKTGHTSESGYGLVGSAINGGQRLIVVVNGLDSSRERREESRKLLEWGFRNFQEKVAFEPNEIVAHARVFGGEKGSVALRGKGAVKVLLPRANPERLRAEIAYEGPIMAPVEEGEKLAVFRVTQGDRVIQESPLYAAESVSVGPLHRRALSAVTELATGWM